MIQTLETASDAGHIDRRFFPEEKAQRIIGVFNRAFREKEQTILVAGTEEPVYLPAGSAGCLSEYHEIHFAHGYAASALHETAHWLIAGRKRRELVDYGYWYAADGRTPEQQAMFESVEVRPQAIEFILSVVCILPFRVSIDNLEGGGAHDAEAFRNNVRKQAVQFIDEGLSPRTQYFVSELQHEFGTRDINIRTVVQTREI